MEGQGMYDNRASSGFMPHQQNQQQVPMDTSNSAGQNGLPVPISAIKTEDGGTVGGSGASGERSEKQAVMVVLGFLKKHNFKVMLLTMPC